MADKKRYSVDMHFPAGYENSQANYSNFVAKLQEVDPRISENPMKLYIGFKYGNKVVVAIRVQKSKLVLELYRVEPEDLNDPKGQVKYKANSYEDFNKHVSTFYITDSSDVEYATMLSMQVVDKYFR